MYLVVSRDRERVLAMFSQIWNGKRVRTAYREAIDAKAELDGIMCHLHDGVLAFAVFTQGLHDGWRISTWTTMRRRRFHYDVVLDGLLVACHDHSSDVSSRLVLADLLEERGQDEHARTHRLIAEAYRIAALGARTWLASENGSPLPGESVVISPLGDGR